MARIDAIKHVVLLLLENRSFDHVLGGFRAIYPNSESIDTANPGREAFAGATYNQQPGAARVLPHDVPHEFPDVRIQLTPGEGFVEAFAHRYPTSTIEQRAEVLRYHDVGSLVATHALAANFLVCDHWFASVPGPTWPNRLFALSGTSLGRVTMPEGLFDLSLHWYDQTTVFDRLTEKGKSWKVYHGDTPLSLLFVHQWEEAMTSRYEKMPVFYRDAAGAESDFPAFTLLEPAYSEPGANDDHPPHDVWEGEGLIASVYGALRANRDLWESTLLVLLFDEHGGFYDHVAPGPTVAPDHHAEDGFDFKRLGVRVPAILASPWLDAGVCSEVFDHTSLLKFLIDQWDLGPLGDRTARASTAFAAKFLGQPRSNTPVSLLDTAALQVSSPAPPISTTPLPPPTPAAMTSHKAGIVALSHVLESMTDTDPAIVAARNRQVLSNPQSQLDAAADRFEAFIAQQKQRF